VLTDLLLVSAAYDFTDSGDGSYSVEVYNLFHYVGFSNDGLIPILATGGSHLLVLTAQHSKARMPSGLAVAHTFVNCDEGQKRTLTAAAVASRALIEASLR
jgi:hypothetical protein